MRIGLVPSCVLVLSPLVAFAQPPDPEKVQVRTEKVGEGVHVLMAAGGNMAVSSGADGVFLVDDEWAPLTPKVKAAIAAISDRPIRFVLNTHWHPDHTGGNENLGQAGALIVAHDNVRRRMSTEQFIEALGMRAPASPLRALPVVTFDSAVTLHLNGDEIHAFHVPPAHTDGDAVVFFRRAKAVHMGDLFFNGMYPFIDVSSGGSLDGMIAAADRILALVDAGTRIIPGHGPVASKADLQGYRQMMVTVRDRIRPLVAAGKTPAEIAAAKPLADLDARWGKGFMTPERFAPIVAQAIARDARAPR